MQQNANNKMCNNQHLEDSFLICFTYRLVPANHGNHQVITDSPSSTPALGMSSPAPALSTNKQYQVGLPQQLATSQVYQVGTQCLIFTNPQCQASTMFLYQVGTK